VSTNDGFKARAGAIKGTNQDVISEERRPLSRSKKAVFLLFSYEHLNRILVSPRRLVDCVEDDLRIGMIKRRPIYATLHVLRPARVGRYLYELATTAILSFSQEFVD
jgi:hypothetical protein